LSLGSDIPHPQQESFLHLTFIVFVEYPENKNPPPCNLRYFKLKVFSNKYILLAKKEGGKTTTCLPLTVENFYEYLSECL
jgi:hypothetical protein